MNRPEILLIYDKECPVCSAYCRAIRIRKSAGDLKIINAREQSDVLDEITANGFNIDQGMVLKIGDQLYYGSDAIHALALISSRSGGFNRVNHWIFKSQLTSSRLYPALLFLRNALLKIMGRTKINNLGMRDHEKF